MAMLVAGEGGKNQQQTKPHVPSRQQRNKIPTIFISYCVCVHNLSPSAKDCYLIVIQKRLVYIITKKTNPKPTKFFLAKFNDPQVYI